MVLKNVTRLNSGDYECSLLDMESYDEISGKTTVFINCKALTLVSPQKDHHLFYFLTICPLCLRRSRSCCFKTFRNHRGGPGEGGQSDLQCPLFSLHGDHLVKGYTHWCRAHIQTVATNSHALKPTTFKLIVRTIFYL